MEELKQLQEENMRLKEQIKSFQVCIRQLQDKLSAKNREINRMCEDDFNTVDFERDDRY